MTDDEIRSYVIDTIDEQKAAVGSTWIVYVQGDALVALAQQSEAREMVETLRGMLLAGMLAASNGITPAEEFPIPMTDAEKTLVRGLEATTELLYNEQPVEFDAVKQLIDVLKHFHCRHEWKPVFGEPERCDICGARRVPGASAEC